MGFKASATTRFAQSSARMAPSTNGMSADLPVEKVGPALEVIESLVLISLSDWLIEGAGRKRVWFHNVRFDISRQDLV